LATTGRGIPGHPCRGKRLLILPSWLVLRGAFLVGYTLSLALHSATRS
jgi:hypothetical protein